MEESTIGQRINGVLLKHFNGKKVCVVGSVSNMHPNGLSFDITTVDSLIVKINLRKPQRDLLGCYIEVHGMAQENSIICDRIVQFSKDDSDEFDNFAHDRMIRLLNEIPDLWNVE